MTRNRTTKKRETKKTRWPFLEKQGSQCRRIVLSGKNAKCTCATNKVPKLQGERTYIKTQHLFLAACAFPSQRVLVEGQLPCLHQGRCARNFGLEHAYSSSISCSFSLSTSAALLPQNFSAISCIDLFFTWWEKSGCPRSWDRSC